MKNFFVLSSLIALSGMICSCGDPTTQMKFKATIQRLDNGRLELLSEVSNYSNTTKTLTDIDIDHNLHKALDLKTRDRRKGNYIPIDNTISYSINKSLETNETYQFRLIGKEINEFISGDVDFIVNDDMWNYRSVSVGCCR